MKLVVETMERGVLKIEIVKRADGAGLLRCSRADGSVTWQRQPASHAVHFTHHDLTHFAVETVLGYERGFFGMIASGWDIEDTTGKGARGPLSDESTEVESVVGLFDSERASGGLWTEGEFKQFTARKMTRELDETAIRAIRATRAQLFERWAAVEIGGVLELEFAVRPALRVLCQ